MIDTEKDFEGMQADGIFGMGFPELCDLYNPLIVEMYKQRAIDSPVFSVYMSNNEFGQKNEELASNVIFGGHSLEKYSNDKDFEYIDLEYTGYWSVKLDMVKVDSDNIKLSSAFAILDTGTSLLIGPEKEVTEILNKIGQGQRCVDRSGLRICDCKQKEQFPNIEFWLNGKQFVVQPEEYMLKFEGQCAVMIASINFNAWILGDVFLRSYYTWYDMEKRQVGIARAVTASKIRQSENLFLVGFFYFLGVILLIAIGYFIRLKYVNWKERQNARRQVNAQGSYIGLVDL